MGIVKVPEEVSVGEWIGHILDAMEYEVYCPEGHDHLEAYENVRRGRCMLCGNLLQGDTVGVIGDDGILGLWCDGECLTDTNTFGFLSEVEEAMTQKVERKRGRNDGD